MRVIVGRVGRPHGVRGDLVIGVRTDEPDLRFAVGAVLDASGEPEPTGDQHTLTVARARWHSGQLLVAFEGVTDRTAAAELTGTWLSVDAAQLPRTGDPDEFRDHELIGLSVRTPDGEQVGVVTDVLHHGQDLLVIKRADGGGEECLVPFVKAIVPEVDVDARLVVIDPPPGLLDLEPPPFG
jgi:16S rRNA processing protein RimM